MNIVFFSTNSNIFEGTLQKTISIPSNTSKLEETCKMYKEHSFTIVTQLPGMFLLDLNNNELSQKCENIQYEICPPDFSIEQIADSIKKYNPQLVIAASFYVKPYDWLSIKDAMVAEELKKQNISVICHSKETASLCFDKRHTQSFAKNLGIKTARNVFVQHQLYFCAGNRKEVTSNIYKECILRQIKELNFPIVIKDIYGLSSFGMEVCETFEEAQNYLASKRNNSDRLVEELIEGQQFGTEIYGCNGSYSILEPLIFSVNKYGITSPKQSIKMGPVNKVLYKTDQLKTQLLKLAQALNFNGAAQVDLVYKNGDWYLIEINPRLSGMSTTYSCLYNTPISTLLLESSLGKKFNTPNNFVMNFKLPLMNSEKLFEIKQLPYVSYISQIENFAAKQEREKGYAEIIIKAETIENLSANLMDFKNKYNEFVEPVFFENAQKLLKQI